MAREIYYTEYKTKSYEIYFDDFTFLFNLFYGRFVSLNRNLDYETLSDLGF